MRLFANANYDFMGVRKYWIVGSLVLNVVGLGIFFTKSVNLGIDFTGGTEMTLKFAQAPDIGDVRSKLEAAGMKNPSVTTIGDPSENELAVRIAEQPLPADAAAPGGEAAPETGVARGHDVTRRVLQAIGGPEGTVQIRSQNYVGPSVAPELRQKAFIAVIASMLAMLAYIWFRFRFQWGLGAILATLHDIIITLGIYSVSRLEFSLPVLASFLTLVGYSVNDTIVVFDRIRENLRAKGTGDLYKTINLSINQTLSRTIITSFLTWIVCVMLFLFGGEALHGFAFVLVVGIIVGTYSSIFIASPVILFWEWLFSGRKPAAAGAVGTAKVPRPAQKPVAGRR